MKGENKMTCKEFSNLLDMYLEGGLDQGQTAEAQAHLAGCDDCRLLLGIREDCRRLDEEGEVPGSFSSSWRQAIRQQEGVTWMERPKQGKTLRISAHAKRLLAAAAALVLIAGGTWMVGRSRTPGSYTANEGLSAGMPAYYAEKAAAWPGGEMEAGTVTLEAAADTGTGLGESGNAAIPQQAKIIRTLDLRLSTRAFDEDLKKLSQALADHDGYVEYSDVSSDRGSRRYANLTLRVPKGRLDAYLAQVAGIGRTVSYSESQQDVSEQYSDTETRLKTQATKMERLLDLLSKASLVEDVLEIEREIADTQYQIDRLTGSLRGMDSKVDYSTVSLHLTEETATDAPGEPSLGERIGNALSDAFAISADLLENVLVFVVVILPYAAIITVIVLLVRAINRRKRK